MLHLPPDSHRYDLMAKVVGVGAGIAAMSPVSRVLTWAFASTGIEPTLRAHDDGVWVPATTELLCFLTAMLMAWRFLFRPLLVPAATWLFLKLARDTKVSWSDSVALAPLLQLGNDATWFPVPELPSMPEGHRVPYLYALAEKTNRLAPSTRATARYLNLPAGTIPVAASKPVSTIDRHPELTRKVGRLPARVVGLLMLALGGLLGYLGVVAPLHAIARHEQHIRYHYEATVAAPAILVIGILYSALGSRASRLLGLKGAERPTQLGLVLLGVLVLAGFVLHGWLQVHVETGVR
jgi:hypothetical protein